MKAKNILTYSFTVLAMMLAFISCTEEYTPELDTTYARLVVDGGITTDTAVHKVTLFRSGDPLNKLPLKAISNAIVTITDGTTILTLTENPSTPGIYETPSNVYGVPGRKYNLSIANVDIDEDGKFETYTASSYLKNINPIDSIRIVDQNYSSRQKGWLINMFTRDIGGKSFYCVKAYKNNKLVTDSLKEYGISNNIGFEGSYYPGISVYYFNNDKDDEKVASGDTITLELNGITEEYFNFINGCLAESRPKDPIFSGPSANVITNISPADKAMGFFKVYSIRKKTAIYKGETGK
jgi:hypothetical protein